MQVKKGFDLFNYQYKKLNKSPIKTFKNYENVVQFIQGNHLVNMGFDGFQITPKHYTLWHGPYMPDGTNSYEYHLKKKITSLIYF